MVYLYPSRLAALAVAVAAVVLPSAAQDSEYWGALGNQVVNLRSPVSADTFPAIQLGWASPAFSESDGSQNAIVCLLTAKRGGDKVVPEGVTLGGDILNLETAEVLATLGEKIRPFNPDARFSWDFPDFSAVFSDDQELTLGVFVQGQMVGSETVDLVQTRCRAQNRSPCEPDQSTACLLSGDRFKVSVESVRATGRVTSRDFNSSVFDLGAGHSVAVQVLNGCNQNGHFWVGLRPETDLDLDIVIEDTHTGEVVSYGNSGVSSTDDAAFPTCP